MDRPDLHNVRSSVVVGLIHNQATGLSDREITKTARRFANGVVGRETRAALQGADPGWVDMTITSSEVQSDLFDFKGLASGRIQAVTSEQLEALPQADVVDVEQSVRHHRS